MPGWRAGAAAALIAAACCMTAGAASAQDYPTRTITLVAPFPPGGGNDTLARIVAAKLTDALGQQVVVDNRAGAAGVIGTRAVAKAAPDGYTLLLANSSTLGMNPNLYANPGYDVRKDFTPIGLFASMAMGLLTHPDFPAKSVGELVALAKAEPGKHNLGTSAVGSGSYLAAELFKATTEVDMTLIPYKGVAALTNDLVGGHVKVAITVLPPALGSIQAGKLRALAVTSRTRLPLLPDVPTADQSGLPGFEFVLNYGLVAPAGTPPSVIARINRELRTLVNAPDVKARIAAEAGSPLVSTPEEYVADIERDDKKWGPLIRKLGLKVN
jgi:tripartite-type tricarboxylate transporter receptor subunit TctC